MNLHRSSNGLHALDLRPCKVVANGFVVLQSNYTNQGSYVQGKVSAELSISSTNLGSTRLNLESN